jgi:hypothetical protein
MGVHLCLKPFKSALSTEIVLTTLLTSKKKAPPEITSFAIGEGAE